MPIRILLCDDSVVIRKLLTTTLSEVPGLEIVATAALGRIALAKIPELQPDIVILDVEMPEMDGIETLKQIRKIAPKLPVIMFSTKTDRGAAATIEALTCGASDYVTKPSNTGNVLVSMQRVREEMVPKIQALTASARSAAPRAPAGRTQPPPARPARSTQAPQAPRERATQAPPPRPGAMHALAPMAPAPPPPAPTPMGTLLGMQALTARPTLASPTPTAAMPAQVAGPPGTLLGMPALSALAQTAPAPPPTTRLAALTMRAKAITNAPLLLDGPIRLHRPSGPRAPVEIVAIGASTGGPNALATLLTQLPAEFPVPIVIVQHMLATFTRHFAERLATQCQIKIVEANAGDVLLPGRAYIARGDYHLLVERRTGRAQLALNQGEVENFCRPAVDVLFRSVATSYGAGALAVVLTGMGHDGLLGCGAIRDAGGDIIVQDEATSVVWGMPGFIARAGLASQVMPLEQLGVEVRRRVALSPRVAEGRP